MGSLWGSTCECRNCEFWFSSHHSHGSYRADPPMGGYFYVVCAHCATEHMVPTRGARGPADGERMELCAMSTEQGQVRLQGSGEYLEFYELADAATWSDLFTLATTACPACCEQGVLKVELHAGDACPRCKQMALSCDRMS
ncbi:hypothetical protein [Lysobacter sp. cf310]|uniref:hypothetical protein n=1 Tax=Lysobacter sp. cf310 TaxID=1761790 RepID=UPI0008F04B2F|nr:hypothetical protein [Lysobacter sp. cf310]SFL26299.1 hypothetical protein SAMN04487938_3893 [Lysobacter sp. cf310]